jgi:hypothetical protein
VKVYVAGASREMDRCAAAMALVRELGGTITCDWVENVRALGAANEGMTDEARRSFATEDLKGVSDADVLWLLAPEGPSAGAWTELGFALALRSTTRHHERERPMRIVVSGAASARSIFSALADEEIPSDIAAARRIALLVEGRVHLASFIEERR